MCGRFTYRYTWSEIHALYRLTTPPANLQPRYNICPTTPINTVVARDGRNELVPMRRGLIPSWWKKKAKEAPATFDGRRPMGRMGITPALARGGHDGFPGGIRDMES
jgi:putative SOS response-associated peptidase YedK